MTRDDFERAIGRGFWIEEWRPGLLRVSCRRCPTRWSLKAGAYSVGTVLHLLNHEAGHSPSERRARDERELADARFHPPPHRGR